MVWPVKAKSSIKGECMKVCGHHEEIDGYWCFVENVRGNKIIHEKIPLAQHLRDMTEAQKRLYELVTMDRKDFVRRYGR